MNVYKFGEKMVSLIHFLFLHLFFLLSCLAGLVFHIHFNQLHQSLDMQTQNSVSAFLGDNFLLLFFCVHKGLLLKKFCKFW